MCLRYDKILFIIIYMVKSNTQIKLVFCIPDMIIGGVETVFVNTINELLKYGFDISIITHRKITEPLYVKWLSELKGVSVYTEFPWSDFFENMERYCRIFPLKQIRKFVFSLYKNYRRLLLRVFGRLQKADIIIDYKNFTL